MTPFDVQAIGIRRPYEEVFRYVADPGTLPLWTHAFAKVERGRAELQTPSGAVTIDLEVVANADVGTVDWIMAFPDGSVGRAHARVVRNVDDSSILAFVLLAPPVPQELIEGTLEQQRGILREELQRLKEILEHHA
jgi:hypothetical protein